MNAVQVIERAIESGVLTPELMYVPTEGASEEMIAEEERLLGRHLSLQFREVLKRWNGLNLDVVRLSGCGDTSPRIERLSKRQWSDEWAVGSTAIGSDPAGFVYFEKHDGGIFSFDHDGGEIETLATDLDDFFGRYLFGEDAHLFGGDDWKDELRSHGLL